MDVPNHAERTYIGVRTVSRCFILIRLLVFQLKYM